MVILHIASIDDNPFSGVCAVVPQYVTWQSRLGNDVALVNVNGKVINSINNQIPIDGKVVIDRLKEPFNKPDIVVFQECYRREYIDIGQQLKKKKIPFIIIPHGELGKEAQRKKPIKKKLANIMLFNRFINQAKGIQCLSDYEYSTTFFGDYRFVATNGVLLPQMVKDHFNKDSIIISYIGRLDAYHKGLDLLIQAVSKITSVLSQNKATIHIYGPDYKGRKAHLLSLIREAKVEKFVFLHDAVTGEEKERILYNSDAFIQTSRFEGMPLGILEALSYGLPCIVTRGTTLGEEIEKANAGWFSENNSTSIADAILRFIKDMDVIMDKSVNARGFVKEKYTWDAVTRKTLRAYEHLLQT